LVGNQFLDVDIVLMNISLSAVPDIGRVIFHADSHEFLEPGGRSFTGDSFGRVGKDDVIVCSALRSSLAMECIGHKLVLLI
jgi:hypothetical protein